MDAWSPKATSTKTDRGATRSPCHRRASLPEAVTGHGKKYQGPNPSCSSHSLWSWGRSVCSVPPPYLFYACDNGSCLQNVLSETRGIYQPEAFCQHGNSSYWSVAMKWAVFLSQIPSRTGADSPPPSTVASWSKRWDSEEVSPCWGEHS